MVLANYSPGTRWGQNGYLCRGTARSGPVGYPVHGSRPAEGGSAVQRGGTISELGGVHKLTTSWSRFIHFPCHKWSRPLRRRSSSELAHLEKITDCKFRKWLYSPKHCSNVSTTQDGPRPDALLVNSFNGKDGFVWGNQVLCWYVLNRIFWLWPLKFWEWQPIIWSPQPKNLLPLPKTWWLTHNSPKYLKWNLA